LCKNLPRQQLLWKLPLRLLLDAITAWKGLLAGEGAYFIAILKAHAGFVKWLFIKQGAGWMPASRSGRLNGWLNKSIVWAYFVRGKRKFSEIIVHKPV